MASDEAILGLRAVAQRIVDAENNFIGILMKFGDISRRDAERVLAHYRKKRLVKLDSVGGRITVKHGALLDREAIRSALA